MLYKGNIQKFSITLECIDGRFNELEHYLADYAKGVKGHGLDIGPGPYGQSAKHFTMVDRLDGCDIEEEILNSLPPKYEKKFYYKLGSTEQMPYKDGELDFVVCSCVVHHLEGMEEFRRGMEEILRVLKKGGTLFL